MGILWEIKLLGGLRVARVASLAAESVTVSGAGSTPGAIERFRTRKTGALLAYLALYPQAHAREVLCEMLWLDAPPNASAQSLRTALSSLRRQLEPPGVPAGAVLIATRTTLQLNAQVVSTDAREFQIACKTARSAPASHPEKTALLERAVNLYSGPLLPGFYDEWILSVARELEEEYFSVLQQLLERLESAGETERALVYVRAGIVFDETRPALQNALSRLASPNSSSTNLRAAAPAKKATQKKAETQRSEVQRHDETFVVRSPRDRRASATDAPANQPEQNQPVFNDAPVILPAILDRFFGRENEINRICQELEGGKAPAQHTRLLTITGAGGSGKTRLAIEAAHQFVNARWQSEQAVFYVPLADIRDEKFLVGAILEVMALPRAGQFLTGIAPEAAPFERLVAALGARPTLLVLDNFEHLATTGAPLLQSLLERAPKLQLLVTSQQRLAIAGGREITVGGLPFPACENTGQKSAAREVFSTEKLWEFPAVQMFVERAQTAGPDFGLTRHNAAAVAEICRRLEGVPLALELAAARVMSFTPAQIAARLADVQEKFAVLTSVKRPATMRHFSLHTAITWSYELLPDSVAKLWTSLSIFRGGFTLEAAQVICADESAPHRLGQLRACSLLNVAEVHGTLRFRLPELLREYAAEKQRETDSIAPSGVLPERHARYYEAQLAAYAEVLRTEGEADALALAIDETENACAALEWAAAQTSGEHKALAASLALSVGVCLQRYGLHREAQSLVESGLEIAACLEQAKKHLYPALLREHAGLSLDVLEWKKARTSAAAFLKISRKTRRRDDIAAATNLLGLAAKGEGDWAQARKHFAAARELFAAENDVAGMANTFNNLGLVEYLDEAGDKNAAADFLQKTLRLRRKARDRRAVAETHVNLGALAQQSGQWEKARRHYLVALKIEVHLGHLFGIGRALCNLGEVEEEQGKVMRALRMYLAARTLFEEIGVAYQTYTSQRLAALSGEVTTCPENIRAHARELVRAGDWEELARWALNDSDTEQ
jgi:predicted ATPase/DNA-binding SARP family transcriptional activator